MLKTASLFLVPVILISCSSPKGNDTAKSAADSGNTTKADTSTVNQLGYFKIEGDSLVIPSFKIEVSLSPAAEAKLKSAKETVIVAAYFSGHPKDTTTKEFAESGEMSIAEGRVELKGEDRVATVEGVKFSRGEYDSLSDKDIKLLINIFSGRRSTNVNLLNCDILEDKMSVIKDKKFIVKGKLISEKWVYR